MSRFDNQVPLVSVIVPHVNYGRYLPIALESILQSTLKNFEIIVIESGSDPGDLEIVRELERKNTDNRMRFVYTTRNKLGINRNLGVSLARANLICSFDPDDIMNRWYLEIVLFHHVARFLDVSGASVRSFGLESITWKLPEIVTKNMLDVRNCVSSHALFTRELWESIGGFVDTNPDEIYVHEDWRFWSAAANLGARIRNVPGELVNIRIHGQNMSKNPELKPDEVQARIIRRYNSHLYSGRKKNIHFKGQSEKLISQESLIRFAQMVRENIGERGGLPTILVFLPWLDQSGAGKVFATIAREIQKCRTQFIVLTTEFLPDHAHLLEIEGVEHIALKESLPQNLWRDFVIYLIESREVNAIWQMGSSWLYENLQHLNMKKIKVIDSIFNTKSLHFERHLEKDDLFDIAIFESQDSLKDYVNHGGKNKVLIAPNGINIDSEFQDQFSARNVDLLYLGRFSPEKDPYRFLYLAKRLLAANPHLKIAMAGDGPLLDGVRKQISNENINIELLGHVTDTDSLMKSTKILAVTSTSVEGRPNSILEAMKNGTVVVAHNVGSIHTLVMHMATGVLCEESDVIEMFSHVSLLLRDANLRNSLALNAYENVKKAHSWSAAFSTYKEIFGLE